MSRPSDDDRELMRQLMQDYLDAILAAGGREFLDGVRKWKAGQDQPQERPGPAVIPIVEFHEIDTAAGDDPPAVIVRWGNGRMAIVDVLEQWSAHELLRRLRERHARGPNGPRVDDDDEEEAPPLKFEGGAA
jgi:hypothetical protein